MKQRYHELKIVPEYFKPVDEGEKKFEIRKADRDFKVGDYLILREWNRGKYTDRYTIVQITYIYQGDGSYGLSEEYCILSIEEPAHNISITTEEGLTYSSVWIGGE